MNIKHYLYSLVLSFWCIIFVGISENDVIESAKLFNTSFFDLVKAVFIGLILGLVIRISNVRNYLGGMPLGLLLTGVPLGVIGLGAIGMGLFGAMIIYLRFDNIELLRLPLHATVVGISSYVIYQTIHWSKRDI